MIKAKRLVTKQAEEDLINMILSRVVENKMTISHLKKATNKVINYLESNAILEIEDLVTAKSSIQD